MKNQKSEPTQQSNGSKRERTREALLDAAARLIGEKGLDRTSLEDIATSAGMSRGAIYGNFKDKEELFLTLLESRWQPVIPTFKEGENFKTHMRALGEAVFSVARERLSQAGAAASFQLYILTHEKMRERLQLENAKVYRVIAKDLGKKFSADELPMPPLQLVKALDAVTTGLLFTYFQTPRLLKKEDFIATFEALARGKNTATQTDSRVP